MTSPTVEGSTAKELYESIEQGFKKLGVPPTRIGKQRARRYDSANATGELVGDPNRGYAIACVDNEEVVVVNGMGEDPSSGELAHTRVASPDMHFVKQGEAAAKRVRTTIQKIR